ncbi:MAG: DUF433 domain-containing protein [Nitrospirae bacterium]|nr:DUF433 domain-containing protein [Nitrospirota bacterium]
MKLHTKKQRAVQHPYIEKKAGVCGGEPVIKGTRIRVSLIAELERAGQSVLLIDSTGFHSRWSTL